MRGQKNPSGNLKASTGFFRQNFRQRTEKKCWLQVLHPCVNSLHQFSLAAQMSSSSTGSLMGSAKNLQAGLLVARSSESPQDWVSWLFRHIGNQSDHLISLRPANSRPERQVRLEDVEGFFLPELLHTLFCVMISGHVLVSCLGPLHLICRLLNFLNYVGVFQYVVTFCIQSSLKWAQDASGDDCLILIFSLRFFCPRL